MRYEPTDEPVADGSEMVTCFDQTSLFRLPPRNTIQFLSSRICMTMGNRISETVQQCEVCLISGISFLDGWFRHLHRALREDV